MIIMLTDKWLHIKELYMLALKELVNFCCLVIHVVYRDFKYDYNYNTITHCKVIIVLGEHREEATSEGRPGTSYPPRNEEVSSEWEGEGQR